MNKKIIFLLSMQCCIMFASGQAPLAQHARRNSIENHISSYTDKDGETVENHYKMRQQDGTSYKHGWEKATKLKDGTFNYDSQDHEDTIGNLKGKDAKEKFDKLSALLKSAQSQNQQTPAKQ